MKIPITIRYKVGEKIEEAEGILLWKSQLFMGQTIFIRVGDNYVGINATHLIDYKIPYDKMPGEFIENTDHVVAEMKMQKDVTATERKQKRNQFNDYKSQLRQAEKEAKAAIKEATK